MPDTLSDIILDFKDRMCHLWENCFNGRSDMWFSSHTEREKWNFRLAEFDVMCESLNASFKKQST